MESSNSNTVKTAENTVRGGGATVQLGNGITQYYRERKMALADQDDVSPGIEIVIKDLTVVKAAPVRAHVPTMLSNKYLQCLQGKLPTVEEPILNDLNLVFKPGDLTLLLGPPGCGKTALLSALSGQLPAKSGDVLFNGVPIRDVDTLKTIGRFDATDSHIAKLTVRETLSFADICLNGEFEEGNKFRRHNVEVVLRLLGLSECSETIVGDVKTRGVSGGQRRRVTAAEALVGGASVLLCDELSTGLDSAATIDIVKALKSWATATNGTAVLALLQPPPLVVDTFDQIVCLDRGKVFFAGSPAEAPRFLARMGFRVPIRSDLADFLQEATSQKSHRYWSAETCQLPRLAGPPSLDDWVAELNAKQVVRAAVARHNFQTHAKAMAYVHRGDKRRLKNGFFKALCILLQRQWTLACRDTSTLLSLFGEALFISLLMGAVFWDSANVANYTVPRSGMGALFFGCAILQRQAWQQIPIILEHRAVFYKHRRRDFFPTSAFVIAFTTAQIPFNVAAMLLFTPVVYFMTGFAVTASNYLFFLLTMVLLQHTLRALFMCVGAASSSPSSAQFSSAIFVVAFLLFSGYILSFDLIPNYWVWVFWINPLAYGMRSLTLNEYTSSKYNATQSAFVISTYGYTAQTGTLFMWAGPIFFFGCFILFNLLTMAALHYIHYDAVRAKPARDECDATTAAVSDESGKKGSALEAPHDRQSHSESTTQLDIPGFEFTPVTISFRDVDYTVFPKKGVSKQLLHGVSGIFRPGRLTALMGSSGAGKTTLMDVIAGRKNLGRVEGTIAINGVAASSSDFSKISGYVEQMNIHTPTATIREAFMFSANLRQPQEVPICEKIKFVEQTIGLLELGAIQHHQIGNTPEDGLSSEQRKRVTIGVELSANPAVIFADEPTSGLDARAANVIMNVFQRIAKANRAVVCTIHQPNTTIFEMFDDLLLLRKGGHTIYNGPLGHQSSHLIEHFESAGARPIRNGENPANYMLEVIGAGIDQPVEKRKEDEPSLDLFASGSALSTVGSQDEGSSIGRDVESAQGGTVTEMEPSEDFLAVYEESRMKTAILEQVGAELAGADEEAVARLLAFPGGRERATTLSHQFRECCQKAFTVYWRSPQYNFKRLITLAMLAVLFGTAYLRGGPVFPINNSTKGRSFAALIYQCMDFLSMVNMFTVLPITYRERSVYYRERAAQMYNPGVYGLAIFLVELPYIVVSVAVYAIVLYFLVGMSVYWLWYFYLIFLLYIGLATYIGQCAAFATPSDVVGQIVVGALTVFFNLFSGYLVDVASLPAVVRWIYYIVPSSYAFNGIAVTQLQYCPTPPDQSFYGCTEFLAGNQTLSEYMEGVFGLNEEFIYKLNIPALCGFWVVTLSICALALTKISHDTR